MGKKKDHKKVSNEHIMQNLFYNMIKMRIIQMEIWKVKKKARGF